MDEDKQLAVLEFLFDKHWVSLIDLSHRMVQVNYPHIDKYDPDLHSVELGSYNSLLDLEKDGLIISKKIEQGRTYDDYRSTLFRITDHGVEELERLRGSRGDLFTHFAPASDRIVTLGDNQLLGEAEEKVANAVRVIKNSNSLDPEVKDFLQSNLELGIQLLKKPKTYLYALSGLLLKPLYDAYASAIEDAAKPAIKSAIDALLLLVGLAA